MKHILILEDEDSLLKLYMLGLKYAGYKVTGVQTVESLQDTLKHYIVDMILSDSI